MGLLFFHNKVLHSQFHKVLTAGFTFLATQHTQQRNRQQMSKDKRLPVPARTESVSRRGAYTVQKHAAEQKREERPHFVRVKQPIRTRDMLSNAVTVLYCNL
jgi:hypothetical protein